MSQNRIVSAQVLSGLEVSGLKTNDFMALPDVLTQKTMPVSMVNIPQQGDIDQWPHLKTVKLHNIDADVELLIGTDASNVLEPWKVINSVEGGPYAVKIVSYLKLEKNNIMHVALILGKARVAPLKQTTIPRLELTAAFLAVRVNMLLQKELQVRLEKSIFWTDSTTVLKYISNETKRFNTFVANRIAVIREATDVNQWRYVSFKENPADDASRGMRAGDFLKCRRWINGPEFLYKSEEEWPKLDVEYSVISADDPEVKKDLTMNVIVKELQNPTNYLIHYFSSWAKLKISVAWFVKLKEALVLLAQKRKELLAAGLNKKERSGDKNGNI
ncbi:uncharacterized protein LOC112846194 [Oreochromis niloticus]|uniref:uncharacterized protein LOC112846194 n=1 Tax=Oreochromis niloticus TaxID=8128 RepID=UPI000DF1620C|nr:uncharacterized protein LOC112846194 [Oreochromis niloticus]